VRGRVSRRTDQARCRWPSNALWPCDLWMLIAQETARDLKSEVSQVNEQGEW
jgi:hypothetical protein